MKKNYLEVQVRSASQCSFIPFTVVPDGWMGRTVRIELVEKDRSGSVVTETERECEDLPWSEG